MPELGSQVEKLAEAIREKCRSSRPLIRDVEPDVFLFYLAASFHAGLSAGGFGRIIYNARGLNLKDREDMLLASGARISHRYFTNALEKCIEASEAYTVFMARPYGERGRLHDSLQLLTLDFFSESLPFLEEAGPWLVAKITAVEAWLSSK